MRKLTVMFASMVVIVFDSIGQTTFKKSELGLALGWGAPNGNSVEYSYYLATSHNLGAGIGFSFAGAKYGIGYKYFFLPDQGASPFAGISFSKSAGLPSVKVSVNGDSAEYRINDGYSLAPRAGFRFRTRSISWYVNTGYHFVLDGGGSEYVSGNTKQSIKDFADIIALGGVEISGGMMFRF